MFKKLNSKGFTLIELLIVIIIIGILAAIAFVAYSGATNKAHQADAQSTLAEVKNKMAEYYADHGSYPVAGASGSTTQDVDYWLAGTEGGNNTTMSQTFTDANGYTYAVTPTSCGDTVSSAGVVTAGTTACTGFTLTATTQAAPNGAITVTN
jgi:prepilin-type N-terminal cleavage/methylation domain-containing protein